MRLLPTFFAPPLRGFLPVAFSERPLLDEIIRKNEEGQCLVIIVPALQGIPDIDIASPGVIVFRFNSTHT